MPNHRLDAIDVRILHHLQEDARVLNVDLARAVGLSPSPCLRRVRALERRGVIRKYVTLVDPHAVGLPVSVFVDVSLENKAGPALEAFEAAVKRRPEVMECYMMTGEHDFLLRVVVPDVSAYQHFLVDHLSRMPGVASTSSSFALKRVQYRTAFPILPGEPGGEPVERTDGRASRASGGRRWPARRRRPPSPARGRRRRGGLS